MSIASRVGVGFSVVVMFALNVAGCSKSSPTAPPAPTRQVAALVVDSSGARIAGTGVYAARLDAQEFTVVGTDTAGVAHFALHDGSWCLSTAPVHDPLLVAASVGQVAQRPAGSVDSVLFRLVARPQSIGKGTITLPGVSAEDGTVVVVVEFPAATVTLVDGSYVLAPLAPGVWTGIAAHSGYQAKQFPIVVPAPGDTITAGLSFSLVPAGVAGPAALKR